MGLMGYDALNIGRAELGQGFPDLQSQRRQATFPFLSASLVEPVTGHYAFTPYMIKPVGQFKVALVGVIALDFNDTAELEAETPVVALQSVLSQISNQAQIIIVLAYMSLADACQLAEQVAGLHVIVVAGEGQITQQPSIVNGTLIVQPGDQGKYVGNLSFTADALGRLRNYRNEVTILDETYAKDLQIEALLTAP